LLKLPSLFVTGTDTGVGKTVVTALIAKTYQKLGLKAAPFKPVATGPSDALFLSKATTVPTETISLYHFKLPLSPHLAAQKEKQKISLKKILAAFKQRQAEYDAVIVEGVGGVFVPLNEKDYLLDLIELLNLPVIVVTKPTVGTLNHTLLTVSACAERDIFLAGLIVNNYPLKPSLAEELNLKELPRLTKLPLLGVIPQIDGVKVEKAQIGKLAAILAALNIKKLRQPQISYQQAITADKKYLWHPFTPMTEYLAEKPHPLMIVKAKGSYLTDSDGRQYLDGVSSLWVNVHGHRHKDLDLAVKQQLSKVAHTTLLGLANEPAALLAEKLVKLTPPGLSKVFYSDNGSTAVEVGLKVAYQYWQQSGQPEKKEFVSFVNAYHGDTVGAVSLGGIDLFHRKFEPLLFKAHHVPSAYCYRCPVSLTYPGCNLACLHKLEQLLAAKHKQIAAVVMEPKVQGAAGMLVQPPGYLKKVAALCSHYQVLLIADEVATGFGRTGLMFACEQEEVQPDIMALAKGITGGYLPLAATLFKEEIYAAFLGPYQEEKTFFHGHTYTGNPLAAAAALANLKLLQPKFLQAIQKKAAKLATWLQPLLELPVVGDIRQCGLMVGIELVADKQSKQPFSVEKRAGRQVILKAREKGVIIRPLGDVIVLMPPLAVTEAELKKLVTVTAWAIKETAAENGWLQ